MSSQEQHVLGQHSQHQDARARREESGANIQLRQDELDVRTHAVEAGQITVGTRVVEQQSTIEVPVTREEVTIARHAVDRRPSEAPISANTDVLQVPVHQEEVTAEKQAVIYEDVEVSKRAIHDTQHVSAPVRKEVVDVDAVGDLRMDSQTTRRS